MDLGAAEDGFVNFAIRILRQHRAERAVGAHGTATMADREVAAGETVFVFDQMFRSLDKLAPRWTLPQHSREIRLAKHVAEKGLGVAGDPAVALRDRSFGIHGDELVGTVFLPDTG